MIRKQISKQHHQYQQQQQQQQTSSSQHRSLPSITSASSSSTPVGVGMEAAGMLNRDIKRITVEDERKKKLQEMQILKWVFKRLIANMRLKNSPMKKLKTPKLIREL